MTLKGIRTRNRRMKSRATCNPYFRTILHVFNSFAALLQWCFSDGVKTLYMSCAYQTQTLPKFHRPFFKKTGLFLPVTL